MGSAVIFPEISAGISPEIYPWIPPRITPGIGLENVVQGIL